MTIGEIIGFNLTPDEEISVCQMIVETDPKLEIIQDMKMHISGIKDNFEPATIRMLQDAKEGIIKKVKICREDD